MHKVEGEQKEEGDKEEEEQSLQEPLLKPHSPQEAQEERPRAQSKRLEWFEEVGRAEVGLWGCHGPQGGADALLQEVLRLGRQWKDEIPQLEECTSDSAPEERRHKETLSPRSPIPTAIPEQALPRQTTSLFRGSGIPSGRPELPALLAAG